MYLAAHTQNCEKEDSLQSAPIAIETRLQQYLAIAQPKKRCSIVSGILQKDQV